MQKITNKEMILVRGGGLSSIVSGLIISIVNIFGLTRLISRRVK